MTKKKTPSKPKAAVKQEVGEGCSGATCSPSDYDAGLLNDFGGGDVGWWQDYLRAEIGRANDYWREQYAEMHDAMVVGTRLIDRDLSKARSVIEAIEKRYIDGCDTYEDWKFMGDTARAFLSENVDVDATADEKTN